MMKIIALNGLLGYGYSEEALYKAFEEKPDYVGVDAGSVDPGPYYLGSGKSFTDKNAVKRDLSLALPLAIKNKAPFIIGTAGGSGSSVHLEWLRDIIFEIAKEKNLNFKMGLIYSDVTQSYVTEKLKSGKIISLGKQLNLDEQEILKSSRLVSQIGTEPIIHMLKEGMDVIVAGRACDTAIYAAPCILNGYSPGLAFHMAKIMECGAMCSNPVAAADVMQGYIEKDYFELVPANPIRRCTVESVAAHTMYEQANPYLIYEPDGMVDLMDSEYEQVDDRKVRVSNSKFVDAKTKTLKIEGVKIAGYRTVCIGGINDPQTIVRIDSLFENVKAFVTDNMRDCLREDEYSVNLRKYGIPLDPEKINSIPKNNLGIVIDVVGKTQDIADTVCSLVRARLLHFDYDECELGPKRKSTAGNIAFPFSPSDIHVGEVYEFNIYHLVEVDSLSETARFEYINVGVDK